MPEKTDPLDSFKSSVEDTLVLVERLSTHCAGFGEFSDMLKSALDNDAVARLLMKEIQTKK